MTIFVKTDEKLDKDGNVSGIGSGGSGRSMQLLMKCKYLDELTCGKGTVFVSGTPVANAGEINGLLAQYGVKFGIYKTAALMSCFSSLTPFRE